MTSPEKRYEGLPFEVLRSGECFQIRKFESSKKTHETEWHRDKEDREVRLLSGSGWLIQLDNELPNILEKEKNYKIPAGVWHRIIRTPRSTDIEVQVTFCV